jgi:hypothetical protein
MIVPIATPRASRFWAFQWTETGMYVVLALLLTGPADLHPVIFSAERKLVSRRG